MKSAHKLIFSAQAVKDIRRLDVVAQKRLARKLQYFIGLDDPLTTAERLVDPRIGTYRWRVGGYRVVFDADDTTIQVLRVRHRREVYRDI